MESKDVYRLTSCSFCPEVIKDITKGDVFEEVGFAFKTNHPRLFHSGEQEFLLDALGGFDCSLGINLSGPVLLLS